MIMQIYIHQTDNVSLSPETTLSQPFTQLAVSVMHNISLIFTGILITSQKIDKCARANLYVQA